MVVINLLLPAVEDGDDDAVAGTYDRSSRRVETHSVESIVRESDRNTFTPRLEYGCLAAQSLAAL